MTVVKMTVVAVVLAVLMVIDAVAQETDPQASIPPVVNRPEVEIAPLDVNSPNDDFGPVMLRGGELLIFTSSRSGPFGEEGTQRIWVASKTSSGWSIPASTSESLTHSEHTGATTLTPDGNFMIFAAYEWDPSEPILKGSGRTDLYSAVRVRGEWTNIQNLGPIINSTEWDSQPSLSPDGRTLFFASDRPGGSGGTDLYVSRYTSVGWSAPVNLGPVINTMLDELAPSIAPDMKSLFFSSNGHGGVGGYDIFIAQGGNMVGEAWDTLQNMGTPINSTGDEYFFISIPNSKNSLFSSDRFGNLDIYTAYPNPFPPEALVTVKGHVLEAGTNIPVAAAITVTDLSSGEVVANYNTDDRTGDYYVILQRGHRYSITAEAPDHIFYSDEYEIPPTSPGKDYEKDIILYRTTGGNTRLLVFFDYNKSDLQSESKPDLNRAINFLRQNPGITIEIAGHTDSLGSDQYNQNLSQERANAVLQYMVTGGADSTRLQAVGYGEVQPVADNGTDEGRARNRRVEMRVK
jgi:outer membrane protein OmpA-like peptidoglycan-associated protein